MSQNNDIWENAFYTALNNFHDYCSKYSQILEYSNINGYEIFKSYSILTNTINAVGNSKRIDKIHEELFQTGLMLAKCNLFGSETFLHLANIWKEFVDIEKENVRKAEFDEKLKGFEGWIEKAI